MNSVQMMGRLTKDPVIRWTTGTNQYAIATFTLAVQRRGNVEQTDFPSCKAFGKTAELMEKYCHKGEYIGIEGELQTGSYEKDGKKIYTTEVVVSHVTFTPKAVKTEDAPAEAAADVQPQAPEGFSKVADDDIPF